MRGLRDVPWHLIANWQRAIDAGVIRLEIRDGQFWVIPVA